MMIHLSGTRPLASTSMPGFSLKLLSFHNFNTTLIMRLCGPPLIHIQSQIWLHKNLCFYKFNNPLFNSIALLNYRGSWHVVELWFLIFLYYFSVLQLCVFFGLGSFWFLFLSIFCSSGFYHDSSAGWYYSSRDGLYYKFENGSYVLLEFDKVQVQVFRFFSGIDYIVLILLYLSCSTFAF